MNTELSVSSNNNSIVNELFRRLPISGGLFNPAVCGQIACLTITTILQLIDVYIKVTLGMVLIRSITIVRGILLSIAQMLGVGILGRPIFRLRICSLAQRALEYETAYPNPEAQTLAPTAPAAVIVTSV